MRLNGAALAFFALVIAATAGSRMRQEVGARGQQIRLAASGGGFPSHTCMVREDGTVWCWGNDFFGQLGDGATNTVQFAPVQASGVYAISSVSAGANHTCALLGGTGGAGLVQCWGDGTFGQIGDGSTRFVTHLTPTTVYGLDQIIAISSGANHTCALRTDGDVWCWGDNSKGQLGADHTPFTGVNTPVRPLHNAIAVTAGGNHTCAILVGGGVECWGENDYGQVTGGPGGFYPTPAGIAGLTSPVIALALGTQHTCVLIVDGTVQCWGRNDSGQVGDGSGFERIFPVQVILPPVVGIAAGGAHTCAILYSGGVRCWGLDNNGQLGDGGTANQLAPVATLGISNAVEIAGSAFHTCAMDTTGGVQCWGYDLQGELGDGLPHNLVNPAPVAVVGVHGSIGARGLAAGYSFNCARRGNGAVSCWGNGASGQLGNGTFSSSSTNAANVLGLNADAINLSAGDGHACVVRSSGRVSCWGLNGSGQLGDGSTTNRDMAVTANGITTAVQVAAGGSHTCALLADSTVRCWGLNTSGQLGKAVGSSSLVPVTVTGADGTSVLSGIVAISAGFRHTCAIHVSAIAFCWGDNGAGQLGDGELETSSAKPVVPVPFSYPASTSAGVAHTCGTSWNFVGGAVWCWGNNSFGQIGDSTTALRSNPVLVDEGAIAVSAGDVHTCDLHFDGGAFCWGNNANGQLGAADTANHLVPVPVISNIVTVQNTQIPIRMSSIMGIATGLTHTCALFASGGVACWGDNSSGKLGNGTTTDSARPVTVNSFTANVSPAVSLNPNQRIATVTALVNCPIGGEAHIFLTLEQGSASGTGAAVQACASGLVEIPMTISVHGPAGFQPGPATAQVEAVIKDQGRVTDDQHWSRAVVLAFP